MAYSLKYDPELDTLFVAYPGEHLQSERDVDVFYQRLYDKLEGVGHKVYFVSDMADFTVDPSVANYYAEGLRKLTDKYVLAIFRYNVKAGMQGLAIRLASLQSGIPANIFPDRESVMFALNEFRRKAGL